MPSKRRGRSHSDADRSPTPSAERKRQKHEKYHGDSSELCMADLTRPKVQPENYSVGWICALDIELTAAECMLDEPHGTCDQDTHDSNTYILGRIGEHNIVLACLPDGGAGNNNAAIVATHLRRTFPSITLMLMVGIGGGVPGPHNPRLGDVVIGTEVIQYDLVKSFDDHIQLKGIARRPDSNVRTALTRFKAGHETHQKNISNILQRLKEYITPDPALDVLFCGDCEYSSAQDCEFCDQQNHIRRAPRSAEPHIHYGKIASGNRVVRNAIERDSIAEELDVLCIDMEAAGVMDSFTCLSIRGLSDYADSHKNDIWQTRAANAAAACTKEFLAVVPPRAIPGSSSASINTSSSARQQQQPRVVLRNIKTGRRGRQLFETKEGLVVLNVSAEDDSVQAFGSKEILQIASGICMTENIESPDADDSTEELMDECASAYARR
ncbi:Pfs domain protein [Fusarium sp. NRRL 25303]|nr:Pfs domain protein [Fusarium sp. NRRL 25303]